MKKEIKSQTNISPVNIKTLLAKFMVTLPFVVFLLSLSGCFSASYDLDEKTLCPVLPPIKKIAIIPFFVPVGEEMGVVKEGKIEETAPEKLSTFSENKIREFACFDIVSWEEVLAIYQREERGDFLINGRKDMKNLVIDVGKKTGSDAVLVGYVTKYADRVGEKYGVSRPASVGFVFYLFSAKDGSIIWTGSYRETQTALSENLFNIRLFLKRGMKWLTADELAKWGVSETLKNFPGRVK
ncbi:MAG: hypothetical protein OHK0040_01870 [bacterium]